MTVQINNEDSAIKWAMGADADEQMKPYRDEVQSVSTIFLLMKYHTRKDLQKHGLVGCRAPGGEEEDPQQERYVVLQAVFISRLTILMVLGIQKKVRPDMQIF